MKPANLDLHCFQKGGLKFLKGYMHSKLIRSNKACQILHIVAVFLADALHPFQLFFLVMPRCFCLLGNFASFIVDFELKKVLLPPP